jgi:hypothetical protein
MSLNPSEKRLDDLHSGELASEKGVPQFESGEEMEIFH